VYFSDELTSCGALNATPNARVWLWEWASTQGRLRSTAPLKNGWARPTRTHPNAQPGVLRQCHVARRYGSEHASAGRASALGHSWSHPFLLRILSIHERSYLIGRVLSSGTAWVRLTCRAQVLWQSCTNQVRRGLWMATLNKACVDLAGSCSETGV